MARLPRVPRVLDLSRLPPRPRRALAVAGLAVGGWIGLYAVTTTAVVLTGVVARWAGKDPRLDTDEGWPGIRHLRLVDDRLLVGGQTTIEEYRGLADRGVTLVIDVRAGGRVDASEDDEEALAALGLDYAALPIPDGRAPTAAQIRRFLDLVEDAEGRVFAHCGGGVGRSTSLAAAYEAEQGENPSVIEQVAVGPPTIEQIWFVATLRPDHPDHDISPVVAITSRIVDSPRTAYGWLRSWFN